MKTNIFVTDFGYLITGNILAEFLSEKHNKRTKKGRLKIKQQQTVSDAICILHGLAIINDVPIQKVFPKES